MKKSYQQEVKAALSSLKGRDPGILEEEDILHLPVMIRKYLRFSGVVGKEKVLNMRVDMDGRIRGKPEDKWMNLTSVQYNFFESPTRIFYIKAKKMGIPAVGLHLYKNETATMLIKVAGLFTVADARGPEMNQGETVTLFNDMCFMAPATLIDKNIKWEILDPVTVKANYTNGHLSVNAILYFDEEGRLVNFISNDRYETTDGKVYKNYPWSTPVAGYREIDGRNFPVSARAIFHRPDGEFCYAEFFIRDIKYNCKELF